MEVSIFELLLLCFTSEIACEQNVVHYESQSVITYCPDNIKFPAANKDHYKLKLNDSTVIYYQCDKPI